jgi:hypothetical protein
MRAILAGLDEPPAKKEIVGDLLLVAEAIAREADDLWPGSTIWLASGAVRASWPGSHNLVGVRGAGPGPGRR